VCGGTASGFDRRATGASRPVAVRSPTHSGASHEPWRSVASGTPTPDATPTRSPPTTTDTPRSGSSSNHGPDSSAGSWARSRTRSRRVKAATAWRASVRRAVSWSREVRGVRTAFRAVSCEKGKYRVATAKSVRVVAATRSNRSSSWVRVTPRPEPSNPPSVPGPDEPNKGPPPG
jgi:hypothetical protein